MTRRDFILRNMAKEWSTESGSDGLTIVLAKILTEYCYSRVAYLTAVEDEDNKAMLRGANMLVILNDILGKAFGGLSELDTVVRLASNSIADSLEKNKDYDIDVEPLEKWLDEEIGECDK